jgi:hypothetical protein
VSGPEISMPRSTDWSFAPSTGVVHRSSPISGVDTVEQQIRITQQDRPGQTSTGCSDFRWSVITSTNNPQCPCSWLRWVGVVMTTITNGDLPWQQIVQLIWFREPTGANCVATTGRLVGRPVRVLQRITHYKHGDHRVRLASRCTT